MATSGTIGQTVIRTAKLLEHAMRRCGLVPGSQTPEIVESAKESMFMFMLSLSSRGLNLWCIDKKLIGLVSGQAGYVLPAGTLDVLNLLHCTPTRVTGTDISSATDFTTQLDASTQVRRIGVKFSVLPATQFTIQSSEDGSTWTTRQTITDLPTVGVWAWYDLDPMVTATYFRIASAAHTVSDLYLASDVRELPITQLNRDDYVNQPNKGQQSDPATNYYFEKLVDPKITLWPVPSADTNHLSLYRHRQIQDVGSLTQELEIPDRWLEPITWQLALRLAFEIPAVTPDRRKEVAAMAGQMLIEGESNETDHGPISLMPRIGVYTR